MQTIRKKIHYQLPYTFWQELSLFGKDLEFFSIICHLVSILFCTFAPSKLYPLSWHLPVQFMYAAYYKYKTLKQ